MNPFFDDTDYYGADMAGYDMQPHSILAALSQPQQFGQQQFAQPQQPDIARQILSQRFEPTADDIGNAALAGIGGDKYVNPQEYGDARMDRAFKQLAAVAEIQKASRDPLLEKMAFERFQYTDPEILRGRKEIAQAGAMSYPIPVVDAQGNPTYAPRGVVAGGGGNYRPPAPAGQKYTPDGRLIPLNPSTRDQMRLQKSIEGANAGVEVERLGTQANEVLGRYTTDKAAPIMGGWQQLLNVVGLADSQKVQDFETLNKISKQMGAQALAQFGGNDTDKELQIAIESNVDPSGTVGANTEVVGRKVLAAKILQQRPIFEEEWLNNAGSLTAPDPNTGETFSRAWMKFQKNAWSQGLSQAAAVPQTPNTGGPQRGEVVNGFRFKGGNPNDQSSWEPAQ